MDAYEIVRHLNQVLDLCDSLDQSGEIGVIGLTNGKTTSREALRLNTRMLDPIEERREDMMSFALFVRLSTIVSKMPSILSRGLI